MTVAALSSNSTLAVRCLPKPVTLSNGGSIQDVTRSILRFSITSSSESAALPAHQRHSLPRPGRSHSRAKAMVTSLTAETPSKAVLVPIANGTEEMEAVVVVDVLRRAGASVVVASVETELQIVASRGMKLKADLLIDDVAEKTFDLVVLPGGMPGAERLRDCASLQQLVLRHAAAPSSATVAAICAAPVVALQTWGVLAGRTRVTAHPAFSDKLALPDASVTSSRVLEDGNVVTSRGPGTAFEFAVALAERLLGQEAAAAVSQELLLPRHDGSDVWKVQLAQSGPVKAEGEAATALVLLAEGSEELEAIIPADVLVRAGAQVTVAAVGDRAEVTGQHGTRLVADKLLSEVPEDALFDVLVLPGGLPGVEKFKGSPIVAAVAQRHAKAGKLVGAVCGSALLLQDWHLAEGRLATTSPAAAQGLQNPSALEARVVVDGPFVTSRGPGTAFEFALVLVQALFGEAKTTAVAKPMVMKEELVPVTV